PPDCPADKLRPFRVVVRASNWLGDAVMSVPAVRAIKAGRPDMHLTILTPAKLAPMWRLIPETDEVIATTATSLVSTAGLLRKSLPFEVGIVFPNSLRVALELWLAGVPRRVGYHGHAR